MSSKKKELTVQETFYNLCKDLMRYIDKKIVRKYISPNEAQIPKEKRFKEKKYNDNKWRYFYEDEETTEEERIRDIFKNNNFLLNLQKLNSHLNIIVTNMEKNKKDLENLDNKIQELNERLQLYGEINKQLVKYFVEHNKNLNSINKNDIKSALEELKQNNIINDISPDIINFYINNMNTYTNNNKNISNNNKKEIKELEEEEDNDESKNIETLKKESKSKNNINKKKDINKLNNKDISKIPNIVKAFDYMNKKEKVKKMENERKKFIKNIFEESDSSDDNDNSYKEKPQDILNIEEREDEEELEESEKNNNKPKNNYIGGMDEIDNHILNKKVKRNNK